MEKTNDIRRANSKVMLCKTAANKIKNSIMKNIQVAENDISMACIIFHKKHEQKIGRPIRTISEFEEVTKEFSKLSITEVDKLIKEAKKR